MEAERGKWSLENAAAGAIAGFTTVATLHPLDVVRTRFQVNDGRAANIPLYRSTVHAIYAIARLEGVRGIYAGFYPAVLGSTTSWGLYFFFYNRAKQRYMKGSADQLSPGLHLLSAAEAGSLVCLCTNPIWLVKTRLQLQTPFVQSRKYAGFTDALKTILREEGVSALYKGIGPGLLLVIRARLQQRPTSEGVPIYRDSWHVVKEAARFEGIQGFYRGITSNLLKNIPAASITFVVYENMLAFFRNIRTFGD